jgi:hypothetical protein
MRLFPGKLTDQFVNTIGAPPDRDDVLSRRPVYERAVVPRLIAQRFEARAKFF